MSNQQIEVGRTDQIEELHYEPVSSKYKSVQIASAIIVYVLLAVFALLLLLVDIPWLCITVEAVIVILLIINLIILRKAYRFKGYALREHDITYRSGVVFPKITTVPFSRIQQVSISQNPVTKYFDLYAIDVVNGAQSLSSVVIPGLSKEKADGIKNVITQRHNYNYD